MIGHVLASSHHLSSFTHLPSRDGIPKKPLEGRHQVILGLSFDEQARLIVLNRIDVAADPRRDDGTSCSHGLDYRVWKPLAR